MTGKVYLNVHSSTNPGGEIRANMKYSGANGMLSGELNGAQASTASQAKGTVWLQFMQDSAQYHATIANLEGTLTAAHFHLLPGGGVIQPVTFVDSSTTGFWSPGIHMNDLFKGNVYLNVHSSTAAGGEIRANLKLGSGSPVTSVHSQTTPAVPQRFVLDQNYPNPFNPSTTIGFTLQSSGHASLKVYDAIGREVATLANEVMEAGVYHQKVFNASQLSSGVYFATLTSAGKSQMRKLLLIK
jgi:hypothetical protein